MPREGRKRGEEVEEGEGYETLEVEGMFAACGTGHEERARQRARH